MVSAKHQPGGEYPFGLSFRVPVGIHPESVFLQEVPVQVQCLSLPAFTEIAYGEFCYNIPTEIGINETMIARTTKELYILADHTKLNDPEASVAKYGSCTYDRQVTLITDEKADPETVASLQALGIEVHLVSLNDVNF